MAARAVGLKYKLLYSSLRRSQLSANLSIKYFERVQIHIHTPPLSSLPEVTKGVCCVWMSLFPAGSLSQMMLLVGRESQIGHGWWDSERLGICTNRQIHT